MSDTYEPLTPVQVETKLRALVSAITTTQRELADARRAEVHAEVAYRKARAIAHHDPDCPRPARGGVTVGERDAWIDDHAEDEWVTLHIAQVEREICQDGLRSLLAQSEVVRSLSASVRASYEMAGHS